MVAAFASVLAMCLLGSGCSTGHNKMQKEVESLQAQLKVLQGDYDRVEERLMAVEQRQPIPDMGRATANGAGSGARPGTVERPPLKVVKLANRDAAAAAAESTDDSELQAPSSSASGASGASGPTDGQERVRIVARGDKFYTTKVPAAPKKVAKKAKSAKK
jgi:hypothetical protein